MKALLWAVMLIILTFKGIRSEECYQSYSGEEWICTDIQLKPKQPLQINSRNLEVKVIKFQNSVIQTIPFGAFFSFRYARKIDLSDNKIKTIEKGAFFGLESLETLHLYNNEIIKIKRGGFTKLTNLRNLNLYENYITSLEGYYFSNLTSLETLRLGWNYLKFINKNSFGDLWNLKYLYLNDNRISCLGVGSFINLFSLIRLHLGHNTLTKLEFGTFGGLFNLAYLHLNHNKLSVIHKGVFDPLRKLKHLDISDNHITSFDAQKILGYFPNLSRIELNNNPWTCHTLANAIQVFKNHNIHIADNTTKFTRNIYGIGCKSKNFIEKNIFLANFNSNKYFKSSQILSLTENLNYNSLSNFFTENFNKQFYKFSNSTFYAQLSNLISEKITNSSFYDFLDSVKMEKFSNYFGIGFTNNTFYKYFTENLTNSESVTYLNKTIKTGTDVSLAKTNSSFYLIADDNSQFSKNISDQFGLNSNQIKENNFMEILKIFTCTLVVIVALITVVVILLFALRKPQVQPPV